MMHAMRAESLHLLGEGRGAWRERQRALSVLDQVRNPRRRNGVLGEALLACLEERLPRSRAPLWHRASSRRPGIGLGAATTAEALMRRATIYHALGRDRAAAQDLHEARRLVAQAPDASFAATHPCRSGCGRRTGPGRSRAGQGCPAARSGLHLLPGRRARDGSPCSTCCRPAPSWPRARTTPRRASSWPESRPWNARRMSLRDAALQVSFLDQGLPLFDDMVRFQALQRRNPERALDFVERARGRQLLDAMQGAPGHRRVDAWRDGAESAPFPSTSRACGATCPKGSPSSSTSPLEDRLLVWVVVQGGTHFVERPLASSELSRLVGGLSVGPRRAGCR